LLTSKLRLIPIQLRRSFQTTNGENRFIRGVKGRHKPQRGRFREIRRKETEHDRKNRIE
jgi:hypothetical protein